MAQRVELVGLVDRSDNPSGHGRDATQEGTRRYDQVDSGGVEETRVAATQDSSKFELNSTKSSSNNRQWSSSEFQQLNNSSQWTLADWSTTHRCKSTLDSWRLVGCRRVGSRTKVSRRSCRTGSLGLCLFFAYFSCLLKLNEIFYWFQDASSFVSNPSDRKFGRRTIVACFGLWLGYILKFYFYKFLFILFFFR